MSPYRRTSKRAYMSGISLACFLMLIAIGISWSLKGSVGLTLVGVASKVIKKEEAPATFWGLVGLVTVIGIVGAITTGNRFARIRRQESE
jgi:hypothetical protein